MMVIYAHLRPSNILQRNSPDRLPLAIGAQPRLVIASFRRRHGRPTRSRRVVLKDGEENVPIRSNIPSKGIKYMRDLVNTVVSSLPSNGIPGFIWNNCKE